MEIKGIDVSSYQGEPNWSKVAADGIQFAILRVTQKYGIDDSFEYNYKNCKSAGIPIGVYKYSYATSKSAIKEEAQGVVDTLAGRGLDFPVFLDLEDSSQQSLGSSTLADMIEAFRKIIVNAGYMFGIYCNQNWYTNHIPSSVKGYDFWIASYPSNDTGVIKESLRPSVGVGWQYSSNGSVSGISGGVDMDVFYTDYSSGVGTTTATIDVQKVRDDAVDFAVQMANDNSHGYSQSTRSLYNYTNPTSFDCSSLVITAYLYAFVQQGIKPDPQTCGCTYTGDMLNLLNCGFEIVARNQTAHAEMIKGDIELNVTYHTALAVDSNTIVHARSSEGTTNTKDDSGNEIRTQDWYLYSHGWDYRLRFTGAGLTATGTTTGTTTTTSSDLDVDGEIGTKTVTKWQKVMGTTQDGFIDGQDSGQKKYWTSIISEACKWTGGYSPLVKAWQGYLIKKGYSCGSCGDDGELGKDTAKASQKYLIAEGYSCGSAGVDGEFGTNSAKALQRWLNAQ